MYEDYYFYQENNNNLKVDIRYSKNSKLLIIYEYREDSVYCIEFSFIFNDLTYQKLDLNQELIYLYTYYIDTKKCVNGDCDSKLIEYFLDNYYKKITSFDGKDFNL